MTELLQDSLWQLAGAILAVLAILVPLVLFFAQRVRKNLTVETVHNGRLLTITEESIGKLQLVFDGDPVQNARLIEVCVTNSGNQPIAPADFIRPLVISLNDEALILSAAVHETQPNNLWADIEFSGHTIEVAPLLLNPKDSFNVQLLASKYKSGPIATTRIYGVSVITGSRPPPYLDLTILGFSNLCLIAALFLIPIPQNRPPFLERLSNQMPSVILILCSVVGFCWLAIRLFKKTKKRKK